MDSLAEWKGQLRAAVGELGMVFESRFGYPMDLDANYVRDADRPVAGDSLGVELPPVLQDFYGEIAEVSLPDVHIGYFIHPIDYLIDPEARGLPVQVHAPFNSGVVTFGSDGGGGLFSVVRSDDSIWYLPPGRVERGLYAGRLQQPRIVAAALPGFLGRLLEVVCEFGKSGNTNGI